MTTVRVKSDPTEHGYVASLSVGPDHVRPLTRAAALAHAAAVLDAAQRAEYDAAVAKQMNDKAGVGLEATWMIVHDLRKDRAPIDPVALDPLGLEPSVNGRHEAFIIVSVLGERVGQWTPGDCRGHALKVLEAVEAAEQDAVYLRVLRGILGLDEMRARSIVGDLANYRTTWEVT